MLKLRLAINLSALILTTLLLATPSHAARCGGDFNSFVASISADAQAAGISQGVIGSALSGVSEDAAILNFDRRQRYTFNKSFEQYVSTRVGSGRINGGRAMLQRHDAAAACGAVVEHRGAVRRAAADHRRDLGAGD